MAPPKAIWIIVSGATPTAFRSRYREDLEPTLHQLQRKQPDTRLLWFERNRFWESPEQARAALLAQRSRKPDRGSDWRPGGAHKDPRAKYKLTRDQKRSRFKQRLMRGPKPDGGPEGDRRPPRGPRPDSRPGQRSGSGPGERQGHGPDQRPGHRRDQRSGQRPDQRPARRPDQRSDQRPGQRPGQRSGHGPPRGNKRPFSPRSGPTGAGGGRGHGKDSGRSGPPGGGKSSGRPRPPGGGKTSGHSRPPGGGRNSGRPRPPGHGKPGGRKK